MNPNPVLLELHNVSKTYSIKASLFKKKKLNALHQVSLAIKRGQTLALLGESGSGKSTLARVIMRLELPTSGTILIDCQSIKKDIIQVEPKEYYKLVQMIFQDPYSSLNPCKKIWQIISAPLAIKGSYNKATLYSMATRYSRMVGLGDEYLEAYPSSLSGGQRQRVGIARALVLEPDLLILDEALSSLDLSIQAQIINLLIDLQARLGLTYLFISHDMNLIEYFADEVAVMHSGKIIEYGPVSKVFKSPSQEYTCQLLGTI